jgi:hypothetical protein
MPAFGKIDEQTYYARCAARLITETPERTSGCCASVMYIMGALVEAEERTKVA